MESIEAMAGYSPLRRCPHSAPGEQALRSSSGVCEPDSASPLARRTEFKSKDCDSKGKDRGHHTGVLYLLEVQRRTGRIVVACHLGTLGSVNSLLRGVNRRKNAY